jgi:hypothetical protein
MNKLYRRGCLAISTIAAAAVLLVVAPVGASAAEASGDGSTPAESVSEPSGADATEWAPQGAEGEEAAGGGAPPLEHGSSVGSGAATGKAPSGSGKPESTPAPSGSYEPEPSAPPPAAEPTSTPRAGSGVVHTVQPATAPSPPPAKKASKPADVAVGPAITLVRPASPKDAAAGSAPAPPPPVASFAGSGGGSSTTSFALWLLAIVALGAVLGFGGVRFRRHRQRMRRETEWREQDAAWEAALRRAKLKQVSATAEPIPPAAAGSQPRIRELAS